MSIGMLPPAGDPVVLGDDQAANARLWRQWLPYQPALYASGTAALAAAVTAALATGHGRTEVVLPGYGCPALVSAVLHAGGRPVLVDLEPERPWLSRQALEAVLGPRTAAVVAVSLLGIPERLAMLRKAADQAGALLIEDSAQAYPPAGLANGSADLVVLSLGRGKPVSLLGGGIVLCRDLRLVARLPAPQPPAGSRWRLRAKAAAYNLLRRPQLYWIPELLPLGLGETRYQPLHGLAAMDQVRQQLLGAAVERYLQQQEQRIRSLLGRRLAGFAGELVDLAALCAPQRRLLRYPLLAPTPVLADRLAQALRRAGLGATRMYGTALPEVPGLPQGIAGGELPQARDFAARLLTLPVHQGVTGVHVERMLAVIGAVLGEPDGRRVEDWAEKQG